VYVRVKLSTQ